MKAAFALVVVGAFAAGFAGRRLNVGGAAAPSDAVETLVRRVAAMESARASEATPPLAADDAPVAPDRRLEALESRVAAAMKQATDDAAAASAETDGDPELRRLRGLADPALIEAIRVLSITKWNTQDEQTAGLAQTIAACDALLARKIDAPRRAEVMTKKGVAYRSMGDFVRAEATMREALSLVSPTSEEGVGTAMQLAFNRSFQHDCQGAAERFLAIADLPGVSASYRAQCRFRSGNFFAQCDAARARAEYKAVVDELGSSDDHMAHYWAEESRKAIEKLDHPDADAR
jgi:hypothetical protein